MTIIKPDEKVVFFGSSPFSIIILEQLISEKIPILSVVTQPDKPIGRGQKVRFSPLKKLCINQNIPLFQPQSNLLPEDTKSSWKGSLAVIASYGKIIPKVWIEVFKETFNVHPSLVPKYRGVSPIQTAILNGDSSTGVSIIRISPKVDAGAIWNSKVIPLEPNIDYFQAHDLLAHTGAQLLLESLSSYSHSQPQEQDHQQATWTHKFCTQDLAIDWNQSAQTINRKCRALIGHGGMYCYLNKKRVKLLSTTVLESSNTIKTFTKGSWLRYNGGGDSILIQTGEGFLAVSQLQIEGKKVMKAQEFICGYGKTGQFTCL